MGEIPHILKAETYYEEGLRWQAASPVACRRPQHSDGQTNGEGRSLTGYAADLNRTLVHLDEGPGNRQAKAGFTITLCAGFVAAVEAVEDVGQIGGGDACARVSDG